MDIDLIKLHAYELHWQLPEEKQQEAMDWLVENVPREQLSFIFPPYAKASGKML